MSTLMERFHLTKPVDFEEIESGHEVIVKNDRTIIRVDDLSLINEMPELFSYAKLGEQDTLLVYFICQKNFSDAEGRYFSMFHRLCQPLRDAWTWKTMRRIVPDVYEREIAEILAMWKEAINHPPLAGQSDDLQRQELGLFLILYENESNNVKIKLKIGEAHRDVWEGYVEALKEFSRMEPDANRYLQLAEIARSPYSVSIAKEPDGVRYYFRDSATNNCSKMILMWSVVIIEREPKTYKNTSRYWDNLF